MEVDVFINYRIRGHQGIEGILGVLVSEIFLNAGHYI